MKIRKFKRGESSYFQILNDENDVILESQAYQDKAARDNGVDSVRENIKNPDRYERVSKGGKSYFILKAANGQEIGRSRPFDDDASLNEALSYAQKGGSSTPKAEETYATDGKTDDYKPLRYYEARITGVQDGFDRFSAENEHYFTYNLGGLIYLISEGYKSEGARDNGVSSVERNMGSPDRYDRQQHPNGKHYFNLRAGNNQEIATSRWFDSENERDGIISRLAGGGTAATTDVEAPAAAEVTAPAAEETPKKKRKKRAKKPKAEKIEVATGTYPCSGITYQVFISGNGKHYFTYRDKDDRAVLISSNIRGFAKKEEVDAIVEQIAACGSKSANFEVKTTTNNKYYYYLKNDDGKNIGKSFFFDTEAEMRKAMKLFDCGTAGVPVASTKAKPTAKSAEKTREREDDYLPCRSYEAHINDKSAKYDDFIVFEEKGDYFFAWVDGDKVVMRSERYTTEKARDNGIESVIKNRKIEERFSVEEKLGYHFAVLKAGNYQEIARSCGDKDKTAVMYWFPSATKKRKEEAKKKAAAAAVPIAATTSAKREDDYLACREYRNRKRSDKYSDFSLFEKKDLFYFAMLDKDGDAKLRSEGYKSDKGRENGIRSVIKNRDIEGRYSIEEKRGKYFVVLKAGNNQEIGRSCPYDDRAAAMAFIAPAAAVVSSGLAKRVAAATAATAAVAATKPVEKKVVTPPPPKSGGGFKWWWLLPLLLLLGLLWFLLRGCGGEEIHTPTPPAEVEISETEPAEEEVAETPPATVPEPETGCTCDARNIAIFTIPNTTPINITRLGTLPEFGNSHALDPAGFFNKLSGRYSSSNVDKAYLDYVFRSMGYNGGFSDANASLFSNVTFDYGRTGLLGYGEYHGYAYSQLNSSEHDRQAFHIKAANGCDVHFMKTCGNYMFFCDK